MNSNRLLAPRYRFAEFVLSPGRRMLVRENQEIRLIPRYFDLLVLLVERRHQAVHRRDIFDRVWTDVIVSDSALSQAVRTLRRTLGDDSHQPRFIRTVARHGYRFVFPDVVEEEDDGPWPLTAPAGPDNVAWTPVNGDPVESLLQRLTSLPLTAADEEERREAAERLHIVGTADVLARLGTRPGHAHARALLRDSRWDVAGAGPVPFFGQPGAPAAIVALVRLRLRRALRLTGTRSLHAAAGAALAGVGAGLVGGGVLAAAPGSHAPVAAAAVLAFIGACCGALGGAAVGLGMSIAEVLLRSRRLAGIVAGGAAAGATVGCLVQWLARVSLAVLVGITVPVGGCLEGLVLGAATALGYAFGTRDADGVAAPRGRKRAEAAVFTAVACGLAALLLSVQGRPLVGGTIHAIAQASTGAQVALTPIARLIGEPDFGPLTSALIGTGEGALFGLGLALGLTRRRYTHQGHEKSVVLGP